MSAPEPMTAERLAEIAARAEAMTRCPESAVTGEHLWGGSSFAHTECQLCRLIRPRGERAEQAVELLAEVTRLRTQVRFLLEQVRRKDAASGEGDRALAEFLAGDGEPQPEHDSDDGLGDFGAAAMETLRNASRAAARDAQTGGE